MSDELKQLIEDAAKLLGLTPITLLSSGVVLCSDGSAMGVKFNPLDPERGDLWKVAMAAKLDISFDLFELTAKHYDETLGKETVIEYQEWEEGDYQSLALAILRAASAVLKAKGEE